MHGHEHGHGNLCKAACRAANDNCDRMLAKVSNQPYMFIAEQRQEPRELYTDRAWHAEKRMTKLIHAFSYKRGLGRSS